MNRLDDRLSEQSKELGAPTDLVESPPHRERLRKTGLAFLALILIIVGAVLILGAGWAKYRRVRTCLDSSLARMRVLQNLVPDGATQPAELNLVEVGSQLHGLQDDLVCLRAEVREFLPLAPFLGWLPELGPDVASAPILLDMAQALVDGGVLVFDGLSPLVEQMQMDALSDSNAGGPGLDLPQVVAALDAAQPSLTAAEVKLQRAAELQAGLDAEALSLRVGRLVELIERYLPLLRTGVRAAQIAPELLGTSGARTYLILAQNDDERRPTGGWISGMGLLRIAHGQIMDVRFSDSWAVDNMEVPHEVPPDSMFRALWAEIWLFRDANWSPDFPTSARVAESILERDQGITVDGVIAVDQQALRLLVTAMEPLTVRSREEPVTGANVLKFIRDSWTEPKEGLTLTESWVEWVAHRKDFMSDLVEGMLDRVQTQSVGTSPTKLASAVWRGLRERHILIYLHDAEAAELLNSLHWDGALLETPGDYLQVVDANVGFNKVDPNVQRTITYRVDLTEPNQAQAEAVVHYRNQSRRQVETCLQEVEWMPSYAERMHGCYWDYVRFYVPRDARLIPAEREPLPPGSLLSRYRFTAPGDAGPDTVTVEKDKVAFGLFFVLQPGEQRQVRLEWQLPAGAVRKEAEGWHYQLLVQKQAGAPAIPLRVTIALPPGTRLVATEPEAAGVEVGAVTFDLSLGVDQSIKVTFQNVGEGDS